jgi:hypothetical protein
MWFSFAHTKFSLFARALVFLSLGFGLFSTMASAQAALDLQGKSVDPLHASHGKITVFIFARTDCPITNRYVPLLLQLRDAHRERINFWLVYPDKNPTAGQVSEHLRQFAISIPALRDPSHALVKRASATITPEVAVFDANARLLYHGRIDNLYEIAGRSRPAATTHELQDVLNAAIAGKPAPVATAPAVGCYISDLE